MAGLSIVSLVFVAALGVLCDFEPLRGHEDGFDESLIVPSSTLSNEDLDRLELFDDRLKDAGKGQ